MKKIFCLLLLLVFCSSVHTPAQESFYSAGSPASGLQIPIPNGYIDVTNGNVHLEFPLATSKQRGQLALNERLVYDSKFWKIGKYSNYYWWPDNVPRTTELAAGWRFASGNEAAQGTLNSTEVAYYNNDCPEDDQGEETFYLYTYSWTDSGGTIHPFNGQNQIMYSTCPHDNPTYQANFISGWATDASGYQISGDAYGNPIIVDNNGTQVYPTEMDRFGNYWASDSNGNLIDDRGQTPVIETISGNTIDFAVLTTGGNRSHYVVTTAPVFISTSFNESPVSQWNGNLNAIQSIQLPDGTSYSFTYEGPNQYGEMTSMTLPTGGSVNFGWSNFHDSYNNENRWLTSYALGSDPATTFTPQVVSNCTSPEPGVTGSVGCHETVTVHRPSGDETYYDLTLNNLAWNTNVTQYSGAVSSGNILSSTANTFNWSIPCNPSVCTGAQYITKQNETQTWGYGGQSTTTQFSFDNPQLGKATAVKKWDYYSGSLPATPLIQTNYSYSGFDLTQEQVLDAGDPNKQISLTIYNYDTSATPTSGIVGHDPTNASGPYLRSVNSWINTSGSYLTTNFTNDDTGTILSSTDSNGTTTYGHDATDTYITSTTLPTPSSGVALSTSATYDSSSGAVLSTTGMNAGETTQVNQYDSMLRPTLETLPSGSQKSYFYSSNQVGQQQTMDGSGKVYHTETLYDGFGRISRTALNINPNGTQWYQTDYCYDVNGNPQYQSVRYIGIGWGSSPNCSGPGSTDHQYDPLGRLKSVSTFDGTATYEYKNRSTRYTSVNGVQRITQYDALNRVIAVCEVSGSTLVGSTSQDTTPESCPGDFGGTGFVARYSYDLTNHQTTITQGQQHRNFQTDSIGRTIYTYEPERGITTYSYGYNSFGLLVTRKRPKANQPDPNQLTTTTTQYDSLGRVLAINYDDGTPTKGFTYDASTVWSNFPQNNLKGRLAIAAIPSTPPVYNVGTLYSYDVSGNVIATGQCLPSTCGTTSDFLSYSYDLIGNIISATDGAGTTTQYTYSPTSEITGITSSMNNATAPPNLVSNVQLAAFGPSSYQLGNGLSVVQAYDVPGRLYGRYLCSGSLQSECVGGNQIYGMNADHNGNRVTHLGDTVLNQQQSFQYDEFNRLKQTSIWSGQQTFNYVYDRYGNRWQQNAPQGGLAPQVSFNTSNNQVAGWVYDVAGNATNDGFHWYNYDAEGNLISVDGGLTASYVYNALNQRVGAYHGSSAEEYIYNINGQRVSTWDHSHNLIRGQYYWGSMPLAYYTSNGSIHYQHQDTLGTERANTSYNGSVEGTYTSLSFGDGYSVNGTDADPYHFGGLDHDSESNTDHAQFRQYSPTLGRWMSPDPYDGSYDYSNPQSFNRYSYANNNPLSFIDPQGTDPFCVPTTPNGAVLCTTELVSKLAFGSGGSAGAFAQGGGLSLAWLHSFAGFMSNPITLGVMGGAAGVYVLGHELGWWGKPQFKGSLLPRPSTPINLTRLTANAQSNLTGNCNTAFARGIPQYTNANFFNHLLANPIVQMPKATTWRDPDFGNDAVTSPLSGQITLRSNFFNLSPLYQQMTLVHEGIHSYSGWDDGQVMSHLNIPDDGNGTSAITDWIMGGCKGR